MIINNVHIRYEDSEADPSRPFSVGMVIDNISAQSTDENWVGTNASMCLPFLHYQCCQKVVLLHVVNVSFCVFQEPKFVSGGEKAQKLVDLSNFSIYYDTELLGDLEGQALVVRNSVPEA